MQKMSMQTKVSLVVLAGVALVSSARGESPAVGHWSGTLKPTGAELKLVIHIQEEKGGNLKATMDSPDQGSFSLPISASFEKGTLTCELKQPQAKFEGKLNAAKDEFSGQWDQNGKLDLTLKKGDAAKLAAPDLPKSLDGAWEGKLNAGGVDIRVVIHVKRLPGGAFVLALDSPDQGANGIPINAMSFKDDTLEFESKTIKGSYEGKYDAKTKEIKGEWRQGGGTIPLSLKKTDKVSELRRPQTPKAPFPYRSEEVTYENKAGGVKLAGTLTLPAGDGPFPAALLITGSGAQDRDETLMGHKPFLVLADHLTRNGIAVLRVDDRGVGGSTGSTSNSTSEDFAGDVLTGLDFLKSRKEIDPRRLGLIGHSEGGIIAPMVASRSTDVGFIVLMAGTALTGQEILTLQRNLISKAMGVEDSKIKANESVVAALVAALKAEKDPKAAVAKLKQAAKDAIAALSDADKKSLGDPDALVNTAVGQMSSPWFRFFLFYDPRVALRQVSCPVLALNGAKDLQVPPKENLTEIAKALKEKGNANVTTVELAGLNHLFQTCKTGAPAEYAQIEETISPDALKVIGNWIVERTTGR
jgi:uncharacterized protein